MYQKVQNIKFVQFIAFSVIFCLSLNGTILSSVGTVQAQETSEDYLSEVLPPIGEMVPLSGSYKPSVVQGIKIFPDNPLKFDFIINLGETSWNQDQLKGESTKLIKYFLASLTVPDEDMWVNLSPYEDDRIIPEEFGYTQMGRDLLMQDYILKQITASLIYPEGDVGSEFWDRVYEKYYQAYGKRELPVDTFNKVWVTPEKAVVFEDQDVAFVVESRLKVMLESDYMALKHNVPAAQEDDEESQVSTEVLREIIIPELQYEVNHGKNFVLLRQIYNCMILATWFKQNLKESLLGQVYVGKNKVSGVDVSDRSIKQKIYTKYIESFKKGVYNFVKEEYDPSSQQVIPRKYFSGGMKMNFDVDNAMTVVHNPDAVNQFLQDPMVVASANILPDADDFSMVVQRDPLDPESAKSIARAKTFAERLTEIYQFSKNPLFIRYAIQAIGDPGFNVAEEFRNYPQIADWIFSMREEFEDFLPFGEYLEVSPQERPVDVLFTKDGDAIVVAGQGKTGKGSLVKALNDVGWKDSLRVGGEDYTLIFYAGGHAFAATYSDAQNDIREETSSLSDEKSLLKAKFQARAFDSKDFVDVSWTYKVGRVNCIINMEEHKASSRFDRSEIINIYSNQMLNNTSDVPETLSFVNNPSMNLKVPLKLVRISHNVSTSQQFTNIAKRIYENVTGTDLVLSTSVMDNEGYTDLNVAARNTSRIEKKPSASIKDVLTEKTFSSASTFGNSRMLQEDEYVQVNIKLEGDIPNSEGKFMAVMDGHSGKRTALLVKERIVSYFKNALRQTYGDVDAAYKLLFAELGNVTKNEQSGTTLSVVYVPKESNQAHVAVLGDSPVIIKEKGGKINYSPSHSARLSTKERQEAEARGALFNKQGFLIKDSEDGLYTEILELTRALGDSIFDKELDRTPEIYSLDLDQSSFILVASDGIWEPNTGSQENERARILNLLNSGANAQGIIDSAVRNRTNDNVTAIVMSNTPSVTNYQERLKEMVAKWKGWKPTEEASHPRVVIRDSNELFAAVLARAVPTAIIPLKTNDPLQEAMISEAFQFIGLTEVDNYSGGTDIIVGREDSVFELQNMLEDKYDGKLIVDKNYKRKIGELLGYPSGAVDLYLKTSEQFFKNEKDLKMLGWEYLGDFVANPESDNRYLSKAWALGENLVAVDGDTMILGPRQLPWNQSEVKKVSLEEIREMTLQNGANRDSQDDFAVTTQKDVGGIDLNPNNLTLETTGRQVDFTATFDYQNLINANISGFSPVILEMKPVANLPLTLGLTQ